MIILMRAVEDGILAAVAAAKHAAEEVGVCGVVVVGQGADGATVHRDISVARHGALLWAAKHAALDGGIVVDGHVSPSGTAHRDPVALDSVDVAL